MNDDLNKALAELRLVTPPNSPWEAGDIGVGSSPVDYHIATILNAALSGTLIPRADADPAVALMVEKAAERLEANRAQLNFAAILGLLRDAPLPEAIVTALSGWLDAIAEAIRALAPASALAELQALRDERDVAIDSATQQDALRKATLATMRSISAENEDLRTELATLRAQVERLTGALKLCRPWLEGPASGDCSHPEHAAADLAEIDATLTEGAAP